MQSTRAAPPAGSPGRFAEFRVLGFGFRVWGLGFGVWGLGFGVWGLGLGVWGLGLRMAGAGMYTCNSSCGILQCDKSKQPIWGETFPVPIPKNLNPTPSTPWTLSPKPSTLHPKPETSGRQSCEAASVTSCAQVMKFAWQSPS